jgi:micrococcal nuclease
MDKKQVTWIAITLIGVLLIALMLPLTLLLQGSNRPSQAAVVVPLNKNAKPVKESETSPRQVRNLASARSAHQNKGKIKRAAGDQRGSLKNTDREAANPVIVERPAKIRTASVSFGLNLDPVGEAEAVSVEKVLDGDLLRLSDGRKVRLIGIQAPSGQSGDAKEATYQLKKKLEGKDVLLSFDSKQRDRYKRVLGYVFLDGLFVNGWMVKNGYAYCSEWKPNIRHTELFKSLQLEARTQRRGFWVTTPAASAHYLTLKRSRYFHRPECKRLAKAKSTPVQVKSRDLALDKLLIPCRDCEP